MVNEGDFSPVFSSYIMYLATHTPFYTLLMYIHPICPNNTSCSPSSRWDGVLAIHCVAYNLLSVLYI